MKNVSENQRIIRDDILRYKKNKVASLLAILGLVFNCLYFMLLYAMPKKEFTTITIGVSVVLTLIVLLTIFLGSEGVKGYNKKYSIVLLVVAAFQILRIFGYPLMGLRDNLFVNLDKTHTIGYFGVYPKTSALFGTLLIVYLVASAACLIGAAVWGYIVSVRLEKFQKRLDLGEIDVMETIKALDEEDERAKAEAEALAMQAAEAEAAAEVAEAPAETADGAAETSAEPEKADESSDNNVGEVE